MEYSDFLQWIRQNGALIEYLFETLCPMQWLTYYIAEKFWKMSEGRNDTVSSRSSIGSQFSSSRQSVATLLFETDRSIMPILSKDNLRSKKGQRRCSLCCFGCRKARKVEEVIYDFEK